LVYVWHSGTQLAPFNADDYLLSRQMIDWWTNFAKFGNPNGPGSKGKWKPSKRRKHYFQVLISRYSLTRVM
jgi:para-nitrobenzyl esterase